MNRRIWNCFKKAGEVACSKEDARTFWLGALGIRSDGATVVAKNGPAPDRTRKVHAEYRLQRMLDVGSTVYVARIKPSGGFGKAAPCQACRKALKHRGVKKVYYTISNNEYGIWYPQEEDLDATQNLQT